MLKTKGDLWKGKDRIIIVISLVLVFIFMAIASTFNSNGGKVTIRDVYYPNTEGNIMHGQLFVPAGVSSSNPAPAIVNMHGGSDYLQTVSNFSLEFARRGYVVLSVDANRSGASFHEAAAVTTSAGDQSVASLRNDGGATVALEQLMTYQFVDQENIGLIGHSMGGTFIANAALTYPDKVKAIMPWGSGSFIDMMKLNDTNDFTFNVGYVNASSDEMVIFATRLRNTRDLLKDELLMKFFSTDEPITAGEVYGSFAEGTARVIYTPNTTHIGNIINKTTVASLLSFFEQAMPTGTNLSANNQVWPMKEAFCILAILSLLVFAISLSYVLLENKVFRPLAINGPSEPMRIGKSAKWIGILIAIAVPMLTYYKVGLPLATIKASKLFPMSWGNYLAWVNLVNAVILLAIFLIWHFAYGRKHGGNLVSYRLSTDKERATVGWRQILRTIGFAVSVIFCVYFIVNLCYGLFKIDFRFWQFGIMPISLTRLGFIWGYLISYLIVFAVLNLITISFVGADSDNNGTVGAIKQYSTGWLVGVGGLTLLMLIYYIGLKTTNYPPFFFGYAPFPNGHPNALSYSIKLTTLVPTFTFASILNTALYRKTKNIYVGTFVAALLVAMIVVSVNAFSY